MLAGCATERPKLNPNISIEVTAKYKKCKERRQIVVPDLLPEYLCTPANALLVDERDAKKQEVIDDLNGIVDCYEEMARAPKAGK